MVSHFSEEIAPHSWLVLMVTMADPPSPLIVTSSCEMVIVLVCTFFFIVVTATTRNKGTCGKQPSYHHIVVHLFFDNKR